MAKDLLSPPKPHGAMGIELTPEVYASLQAEFRRLKDLYSAERSAKRYERRRANAAERKVFSLSRGHESMKAERNALARALKRIVDWDDFTVTEKCDIGSRGQEIFYRTLAAEALAASTLHTKYPNQKETDQ